MIIASRTASAVYDINIFGLSVTFLLVALAAILTVVMRLGMAKSMIWSTLRSLLQLLAMGYIIKYVIEANDARIVLALVFFMVIAAVQITITRADGIPRGLAMPVLLTLMISVLIVDGVVSELIIKPSPWYAPQILIPVTGMMLGNLVAAIAVAMSRFFSDMKAREYEVEVYLSMGATPFEAAKPSIIASAKLGLIPTIAQLASSGIVLIPGMMAGQIMAGGDPLEAAKYQFVVLAALSSITIIGDTLIMILIYRRCFTELDQFEPRTV